MHYIEYRVCYSIVYGRGPLFSGRCVYCCCEGNCTERMDEIVKSWCCCNFMLYLVIYHWTVCEVLCAYNSVKNNVFFVSRLAISTGIHAMCILFIHVIVSLAISCQIIFFSGITAREGGASLKGMSDERQNRPILSAKIEHFHISDNKFCLCCHGDCLQWKVNIYFSYLLCLLLFSFIRSRNCLLYTSDAADE